MRIKTYYKNNAVIKRILPLLVRQYDAIYAKSRILPFRLTRDSGLHEIMCYVRMDKDINV